MQFCNKAIRLRKLFIFLVFLSLFACNQKQKRPLKNSHVAKIYTDFTDKNISGDSLEVKEKEINIEFDEDKPQPVKGDVERLERVFMNLVSNAIKFSNRGGKIKIEYTTKRKSVEIAIKDEGIGIPKELQTGLFTPFSKARRNGTEGERSTGLGLSIVKMIIDAHHGSIKVNTEEGKGTEFIIILPN